MRILSIIVLWLAPVTASGQENSLLTAGHAFAARLTLDPKSDENLFRAVGAERAAALLQAVINKGQQPSATEADWDQLHRAVTGLIELAAFNGNLAQAAAYCTLQQNFYRNMEHAYAAALAFSERGLELQRRSEWPQAAFVHQKNIGENLLRLGKAEDAAQMLEQALAGDPDPFGAAAATTWREIVDSHLAAGHPSTARETAERFLLAAQSATPLFRGQAFLARSAISVAGERYGEALDDMNRAMEAVAGDSGSRNFSIEIGLQVLDCLLAAMGTLPFEQAVALSDRIGREFRALPLPVGNLAQGVIRMRRRLAGDIEGVLRQDLERLQRARSDNSVAEQVEALRSLGVTYAALNAGPEEIATLEQALELAGALPETVSVPLRIQIQIQISIGESYLRGRELSKARRAFEAALQRIATAPDVRTREKLDRSYCAATLGKARTLTVDDDPDEVGSLLDKALQDRRCERAAVLQERARLERQNQPSRASDLFREAIAALRSQRDGTGELYARLELATFLAEHGKGLSGSADEASSELEVARRLADSNRIADAQWRVDYIAGLLAENARNTKIAIERYRAAVARLEQVRASIATAEMRRSFLDNVAVEDLYRRLIALLLAAGDGTQAWQYLERSKARAFLETLHGRRSPSVADSLPELHEIEEKLAALRVTLSPEIQDIVRGSSHDFRPSQDERRRLEGRLMLLRQQAPLDQSRSTEALSLKALAVSDVQRVLPPAAALIEYSFLQDQIAAFVITRSSCRNLLWKANTAALRRNVLRLRALLADPGSTAALTPLLSVVSKAVLEPVLPELPASIKGLIVVPAGYLHYVPFQVLPVDERHCVIDRYTVSYLPSASTLRYIHSRFRPSRDLFAGALGNVAVEGWPPLPGTMTEMTGIRRAAPGIETLAEAGFTHDAVLRALERHELVHLATHGVVNEQAPLFSALLTSPAAARPARVSLYELTNIRLRARLVVLSACETAVGKLLGGDEIAAFSRALLQSGAESVVASLWKVSDDSTALLMTDFHGRLRAGESPAQALRHAALAVRAKFEHPFYWAPFVLTGAR